jgi:hypothetical protein
MCFKESKKEERKISYTQIVHHLSFVFNFQSSSDMGQANKITVRKSEAQSPWMASA